MDHQPSFGDTFEHGWPFVYLRRQIDDPGSVIVSQGKLMAVAYSPVWLNRRDIASYLPMWGIPWLSAENWRIWEADVEDGTSRRDLRENILFLDCAVASLVLIAAIAAWEGRRRRRPRLLCFGLGDMMVTVTVVSVVLGYLIHLNREHRRESQLDGKQLVNFDSAWFVFEQECIAPVWVRSLVGERFLPNFAWRHDAVCIDPVLVTDVNAVCNEISQLDYLSRIDFMVGDGTSTEKPFKFSALHIVHRMDTLDICYYFELNEQDLRELSQLKSLRTLVLWRNDVAPHLLSRLEQALPYCDVIDADDDW